MIFKDRDKFNEYLRDKFNSAEENLYVVMRAAYSFKELLEAEFNIEIAYLTPMLKDECVSFFSERYTDQQYFEVYECYTEKEMLDMLIHNAKGLEDYTD